MRQMWKAGALLAALILGLALLGYEVTGAAGPVVTDLTHAAAAAEAGEWDTAHRLTRRAAAAWEEADRGLSGGQPPGGPGPARGAGVRAGDVGEFVLGGETPPISAEQPAGDGRCFPGRGEKYTVFSVWVFGSSGTMVYSSI